MSSTKVLVVGATGRLGSLITSALLNKPTVQVSALIRKGSETKAEQLKEKGVQLISGALNDSVEELQQACQNVDVIISAVIGSEDTILDGQLRLLEAAKKAGVKRFIPSDYSADYLRASIGDHDHFDMRKQVAEQVKQSGIGYTIFLNGVFMETFFGPFLNIIDTKNHKITYYGSADTLVDTTTYEDSAKYVVEAALDPEQLNKTVTVSGDRVTYTQLAQQIEQVTGHKITLERKGNVEDLKKLIETTKNTTHNVWAYIGMQYQYALHSGICELKNIQNSKYPNVQPTSIKQWLEKNKNIF